LLFFKSIKFKLKKKYINIKREESTVIDNGKTSTRIEVSCGGSSCSNSRSHNRKCVNSNCLERNIQAVCCETDNCNQVFSNF